MHIVHDPAEVLEHVVRWGQQQDAVRAILLTSTRAIPHARIDALSDYDVVLVVTDVEPFFTDRAWLKAWGELLVVYWDPLIELPSGVHRTGNVTHYADGLRIDFGIWPVAGLQHIVQTHDTAAELDAGYRVLLDKDELTAGLQAPTYRGYIPARPSEAEFQTLVNDFWSDAPSAAKFLWRDELLPAKWCIDHDMKHVYLRPLLEWRMQRDHGWNIKAGSLGRGLKQQLPPELWAELERCYAGASIADNWEALLRTLALFGRVGIEVADDLGYAYPLELDRRVTAYVRAIQAMAPGTPGASGA